MAQVTGVDAKARRTLESIDFADRLLQCRYNIFVCFFIEADVTVTDLNKAKLSGSTSLVVCRLAESLLTQDSSGDCPNRSGAGPCHTFQKTAPVYSVVVEI